MSTVFIAKAVAWLLAPSRWFEVAQDLLTLLQQRGIWSLMVLGLFLVLLSNRQKSLNRLREIAQETRKISTDSSN